MASSRKKTALQVLQFILADSEERESSFEFTLAQMEKLQELILKHIC